MHPVACINISLLYIRQHNNVENMCTNIPTHEVKGIVKDINKNNNISKEMKKEVIGLLNIILEQNFIQHNEQWYKQDDGLANAQYTSMDYHFMIYHFLLVGFIITDIARHWVLIVGTLLSSSQLSLYPFVVD
jgi:hypothetical protein